MGPATDTWARRVQGTDDLNFQAKVLEGVMGIVLGAGGSRVSWYSSDPERPYMEKHSWELSAP